MAIGVAETLAEHREIIEERLLPGVCPLITFRRAVFMAAVLGRCLRRWKTAAITWQSRPKYFPRRVVWQRRGDGALRPWGLFFRNELAATVGAGSSFRAANTYSSLGEIEGAETVWPWRFALAANAEHFEREAFFDSFAPALQVGRISPKA